MLHSDPFLNWALVAVSLFNTIVLAWLGLTVLLNADRRAWGIWLSGGGLLLGMAFFLSHTVLLGLDLTQFGWSTTLWWIAGMVPALILPATWYVTMLWYAGYWEGPHSDLRRRQRLWLRLTLTLLALGLAAFALSVFLLATPRNLLAQLRLYFRWSVAGVPLLALGYSAYTLLCTGLSLDALRRPGPSTRVMGQLARRRARRWLAAASVVLLLVALLVLATMVWLAEETRQADFAAVYARSVATIAWLDFVTATLIAVSVLLLGQAVVSYEVFTGRTLPRRGLARHWYGIVLLAAVYSLLVSVGLALELRPLYLVILTTLATTVALALLSWRSFAARENTIALLRPFLNSQRLYDHMLAPALAAEVDVDAPFAALCGEVLGARRAYLAPLGPLAPLVGAPTVYPAGTPAALPPLHDLTGRFDSPDTMIAPVDPDRYGGAGWAVPLWSQRGLSGVLLLGDKQDGGLYAQEEIEIARASCERLLDTLAGAEMGRRLMTLQRQQLLHNQMVDLRARRVLHDEVLPDLQAALIELDATRDGSEAATLLSESHRRISDLLGEIPTVTADVARLGFVPLLRQVVDREFAGAFDEVNWQIEPLAAEQVNRLPAVTAETLFYAAREAIRNAARHGRDATAAEPYRLRVSLAAGEMGETLEVRVEDNGKGVGHQGGDTDHRGQGLALFGTMMAVVGGSLTVDSAPGRYTRVRLSLPQAADVAAPDAA